METIRLYIEQLFASLPKSQEVMRAKNELTSMMEDKYHELKEQGKSENEAIGIVISEFGNIDELMEELGIGLTQAKETIPVRHVSILEAKEFISSQREFAKMISIGVFLCILSPITLISLGSLADSHKISLQPGLAEGIGLTILFSLVAIAVAIFIIKGIGMEKYAAFAKENLELDYDAFTYVKEAQAAFRPTFATKITMGVLLCIFSVIPIVIAGTVVQDAPSTEWIFGICVSLLLVIVSIAVVIFILAGITNGAYAQLLQEGDYTPQKKTGGTLADKVASIYWPLVVAVYLLWSFLSNRWDITWMVWPVAALIFAAVSGICNALEKEKAS